LALYRRGMIYWYDFNFKKKRYQGSTRTRSHREALTIVAALKTALVRGEVGIFEKNSDTPTPRFTEFWNRALNEIKCDSPEDSRTVGWYEYHYKQCLEFEPLATARLDTIDEKLLSNFRQHLREDKKLSAPTINGRLRAIRRALYIALAWRVISRVPSFPMMSEKGHMREFILLPASRPEFLERSPEKYRAIFEFLLETGLRVGECVSLTWDRVFLDQVGEFGRPYIYIRPDRQLKIMIKSKRARRVPLFDHALEIVMSQQKISRSRFVFVQYGPRVKKERQFISPFSRHDVSRAFTKIARILELPRDAVLHSTRHTMLTELGIAGADASTIQIIAGHEDIRTSQRYLHPTPEHVLMAFERMHAMRRELATRKLVSGTKTACHVSSS